MRHRSFCIASLFALFLSVLAGRGQTVTHVLDAFNTNSYPNGSITNEWSNWFGNAFQSLSLDAASDASGNPASGSLKIVANYPVATDQITVWDGINGISPALSGIRFTNFQCDVRFAAGSATNSSGKFGTLEFGVPTPGYGQSYFGSVAVSATNTNWVHVSITLNANSNTNLLNITGLLIHVWGAGLVGPSTLWVDNLQFIGMLTNVGTATINYTNTQQRIDGFGASSAWMSGTLPTATADLLFSTNTGAGLSLLRTRIAPDVTTWEGNIAQQAQARGARIWSTPWSPPVLYKDTNSVNGGHFVSSATNFSNYAAQLAKYVVNLQSAYGISLYALSIQNEPDFSVTYESCIWTGQQIHDFVPYLDAALTASNVATTKIMLPEKSNWNWSLATNTMNDTVTSNMVDILASHNYGSSAAPVTQFGTPCPKTLWETEHFLGSGDDITNGLAIAQEVHAFMTVAQANAYHYWWLTGSGTGSIANNPAAPAKRLFTLGNYSRFVRPNFYRVAAANNSAALVSAYKDPGSSNYVIVAVNPSPYPVSQTFALTNFPVTGVMTQWVTSASLSLSNQGPVSVTNNSFTYLLPGWTVVSFVFTQTGTNVGDNLFVLKADDTFGNSSFNTIGNWTNVASGAVAAFAPANGFDYATGPFTLRTPAGAGNYTFAGDQLTISPGGDLNIKGAGGNIITLSNLVLGGTINNSINANQIATVAGSATVAVSASLHTQAATNDLRGITNNLNLSGTGSLTNLGLGTGPGYVVYGGSNAAFTGPLIVMSNTTLHAASQNNLGGNPAAFNAAQLVLDNGAFQPGASFALNNPNSGVTIGSGGGSFNILPGRTLTVANPMAGSGNLLSMGGGTLVLTASNLASGNLTISNSTLVVAGNATFKNFALAISNNAVLDVTALNVPLAVSNRIALAGNLIAELNSAGTSSRLTASNLVYGGILTVSNSGPAYAAGNSFPLFTATNYSGAFTAIVPATPGAGLVWDTSALSVNGTLLVGFTVATNPINLTAGVSGSTLSLSWPADHTGWWLQTQTNGLGTNWFTVPGSSATNLMQFPIDAANGSVFYRLALP